MPFQFTNSLKNTLFTFYAYAIPKNLLGSVSFLFQFYFFYNRSENCFLFELGGIKKMAEQLKSTEKLTFQNYRNYFFKNRQLFKFKFYLSQILKTV